MNCAHIASSEWACSFNQICVDLKQKPQKSKASISFDCSISILLIFYKKKQKHFKILDFYTPPEIPLNSYAPPPTNYAPIAPQKQQQYRPLQTPSVSVYTAPPAGPAYAPYAQQQQHQTLQQSSSTTTISQQQQQYQQQQQQLYAQSPIVRNISPAPYAPSPTTNSKIAMFERQQREQEQQLQQSHFQQQARRPLTVPNAIIRNQSPTPFGGGSPTAKPAFVKPTPKYQSPTPQQQQHQQSFYQPQPTPQQPPPPAVHQQQFSNGGNGGGYGGSTFGANPRSSLDLNQLENYNLAARGWGQQKGFYRPITFNKPKVALPYTDF